jgi:hypothetical protein
MASQQKGLPTSWPLSSPSQPVAGIMSQMFQNVPKWAHFPCLHLAEPAEAADPAAGRFKYLGDPPCDMSQPLFCVFILNAITRSRKKGQEPDRQPPNKNQSAEE